MALNLTLTSLADRYTYAPQPPTPPAASTTTYTRTRLRNTHPRTVPARPHDPFSLTLTVPSSLSLSASPGGTAVLAVEADGRLVHTERIDLRRLGGEHGRRVTLRVAFRFGEGCSGEGAGLPGRDMRREPSSLAVFVEPAPAYAAEDESPREEAGSEDDVVPVVDVPRSITIHPAEGTQFPAVSARERREHEAAHVIASEVLLVHDAAYLTELGPGFAIEEGREDEGAVPGGDEAPERRRVLHMGRERRHRMAAMEPNSMLQKMHLADDSELDEDDEEDEKLIRALAMGELGAMGEKFSKIKRDIEEGSPGGSKHAAEVTSARLKEYMDKFDRMMVERDSHNYLEPIRAARPEGEERDPRRGRWSLDDPARPGGPIRDARGLPKGVEDEMRADAQARGLSTAALGINALPKTGSPGTALHPSATSSATVERVTEDSSVGSSAESEVPGRRWWVLPPLGQAEDGNADVDSLSQSPWRK